MKKKFQKADFKGIANSVVGGAIGAVTAAVIDSKVVTTTTNMLIKGIAGLALPMIVKEPMVTRASNALLDITLYQAANAYVIPKVTAVLGLPSQNAVGATSNWIAQHATPVVKGGDADASAKTVSI